MYLLQINPLSIYAEHLFKIYPATLTTLQRKVATVALIIFSCLLACYSIYQIFFKANDQRIDPIDDISHSQVSNNAIQDEIVKPIPEEDQALDVDNELKVYPLLLLNKNALNDLADISFKNVSCIEEARIILIGERHSTPEHLEIEHYIVHHYGKDDDILLMEGAEGKTERFFEHMDTYGWDNLRVFHEGRMTLKKLFNVLKQQRLSNDLNLSQKLNKKIAKLFEQYVQAIHKRNDALIKNLNNCLLKFPNKKIFLIAGKLHLVEGSYNILEHLQKEEKCALLILKDPENSEMIATSYLEKLEKDLVQLFV
jgi:hypothetical protein